MAAVGIVYNAGPYQTQKAALVARGRLLRRGLQGRVVPAQ